MSIKIIHTIARNEARLLRRSWLFRTFALLTLFVLTLAQIASLSNALNSWSVWDRIGIASFIPAFTSIFYSVGQSIIVIFLAGGILKRNQKLDTAEVYMIRPFSNADYMAGKVLGIVRVFLGLNLIPIAFGAIIALVINDSPFQIIPYLFYPLAFSLPSLLFILACSFFVMNVCKNQAVTFIIMSGFIGLVFNYLDDKLFGVFDFTGIQLPNVFSEITGHANLPIYLLQRAVFLILGIGFLGISTLMMQRLPNRPVNNIRLAVFSGLFIMGGLLMGWQYVDYHQQKIEARALFCSVYQKYANHATVSILSHQITLETSGQEIKALDHISFKNATQQDLDSFILFLNPGLTVSKIQGKGEIPFKQEQQAVVVQFPIKKNSIDSLSISYDGFIDENICYLDITDQNLWADKENMFRYGQRFAFCGKDYALFTPEVLWYPVSLPPVDVKMPYSVQRSFANFSLTVKNPQASCVAQGEREIVGSDTRFACKKPLTGMTFAMGDYETRTSVVDDSLQVELWNIRGHDFFRRALAPIADSLPAILDNLKTDIEGEKRISFPFRHLRLVETPISFDAPYRNWKGHTEHIQPEIILYPEQGIGMNADFEHEIENMDRWQQGQRSEEEMRIDALRNFVAQNFREETSATNIAPMFYLYRTFITADSCPLFNIAFSNMQATTDISVQQLYHAIMNGLNDSQRANIYLNSHSLADGMRDSSLNESIFLEAIRLKSAQFKNHLLAQFGIAAWNGFVHDFYLKHTFQTVDFDTFAQEFNDRFQIDLPTMLQTWFREIQSPGIQISDVKALNAIVGNESKYQIRFNVKNDSEEDAELTVTVMSDERGPWGGTPSDANANLVKHYTISGHQAYQIRFLSDERPSRVTINTGVSANLPNDYTYSFQKVTDETSEPQPGIFPINPKSFLPQPGETIIDNEDANFKVEASERKRFLQTVMEDDDEEDKYKGFTHWNLPLQWTSMVNSGFYGNTVHSAVYKKTGTGLNRATWKTQIPQDNYYEIYTWYAKFDMPMMRQGSGRRNESAKDNIYTYVIHTVSGDETVTVNYVGKTSGWILIGSFYLPQGEVSVSVLDKASENFVVADAIKISPEKKKKKNNHYTENE